MIITLITVQVVGCQITAAPYDVLTGSAVNRVGVTFAVKRVVALVASDRILPFPAQDIIGVCASDQ